MAWVIGICVCVFSICYLIHIKMFNVQRSGKNRGYEVVIPDEKEGSNMFNWVIDKNVVQS